MPSLSFLHSTPCTNVNVWMPNFLLPTTCTRTQEREDEQTPNTVDDEPETPLSAKARVQLWEKVK